MTKKETAKQRIIDASRELFSEVGYESTSVREIAKKAGVKFLAYRCSLSSKEIKIEKKIKIIDER